MILEYQIRKAGFKTQSQSLAGPGDDEGWFWDWLTRRIVENRNEEAEYQCEINVKCFGRSEDTCVDYDAITSKCR